MSALEAAGRDLDRAKDTLRWYREVAGWRPEIDMVLYSRCVACRQGYREALRQACVRLGVRE